MLAIGLLLRAFRAEQQKSSARLHVDKKSLSRAVVLRLMTKWDVLLGDCAETLAELKLQKCLLRDLIQPTATVPIGTEQLSRTPVIHAQQSATGEVA